MLPDPTEQPCLSAEEAFAILGIDRKTGMGQRGFVKRRGTTWTAYWKVEKPSAWMQRSKGGFATNERRSVTSPTPWPTESDSMCTLSLRPLGCRREPNARRTVFDP
jgi:hypothetical protein